MDSRDSEKVEEQAIERIKSIEKTIIKLKDAVRERPSFQPITNFGGIMWCPPLPWLPVIQEQQGQEENQIFKFPNLIKNRVQLLGFFGKKSCVKVTISNLAFEHNAEDPAHVSFTLDGNEVGNTYDNGSIPFHCIKGTLKAHLKGKDDESHEASIEYQTEKCKCPDD